MIQSTLSLIIQSYAAELSENQISLSSQPGGAHEYFFFNAGYNWETFLLLCRHMTEEIQ